MLRYALLVCLVLAGCGKRNAAESNGGAAEPPGNPEPQANTWTDPDGKQQPFTGDPLLDAMLRESEKIDKEGYTREKAHKEHMEAIRRKAEEDRRKGTGR